MEKHETGYAGRKRETDPFEKHPLQYDKWFEEHPLVYRSELAAVRELLPRKGTGTEIGMGTGRFAVPFGIRQGIEPSPAMRRLAEQRGLEPLDYTAENLPYADKSFDFALMVTTICFVSNAQEAIREAYRVLKKGGCLIVGIVDRDSAIGRMYEANREKSVFYREASFFTSGQVIDLMERAGFRNFRCRQTIFHPLDEITEIESVKDGRGEGSFVVIAGSKE